MLSLAVTSCCRWWRTPTSVGRHSRPHSVPHVSMHLCTIYPCFACFVVAGDHPRRDAYATTGCTSADVLTGISHADSWTRGSLAHCSHGPSQCVCMRLCVGVCLWNRFCGDRGTGIHVSVASRPVASCCLYHVSTPFTAVNSGTTSEWNCSMQCGSDSSSESVRQGLGCDTRSRLNPVPGVAWSDVELLCNWHICW